MVKRRAVSAAVSGAVVAAAAWLTAPTGHFYFKFLPSLLAAIALAFVLVGPAGAAHADATDVINVPVAFQVSDTNGSAVPCFSDGATYTIIRQLTGPPLDFAPGQVP